MPAHDCLRLDDHQRPFPIRPELPKQNPEEPILQSDPWLRVLCLQNHELLPQGEDFQQQRASRTKDAGDQSEERFSAFGT